jgi:hypothetical protein
MTFIIPMWLIWTVGGAIGVAILAVVLFFAYLGYAFSKAWGDKPFGW